MDERCIKEWGPKKQIYSRFVGTNCRDNRRFVLPYSRPVHLYDPEVDPKEVQVLQFAYLHAFELPHQEEYLLRLLKLFSNEDMWGLSIKHPALRFAVCTYSSCFMDHADSFDHLWYYSRAVKTLRLKLQSPDSIDEGDLFAVALLAMWAGNMCLEDDFIKHTQGFMSLKKHLSTTASKNKLSIFWPMAQDELILHAFDLSSEDGDGIVNSVTHTLCRATHEIGGHEALQQRQVYMTALGRQPNSAFSALGLLETSWQQYFILRGCLKLRAQDRTWQYHAYIVSILAGVQSALEPFDDAELLSKFGKDMIEFKERKGFTRFSLQSNATGILCVLLCRLLVLVLEAPSINQGLYSLDGIAAATKILLFVNRVDAFGHRSQNNDTSTLWNKIVPTFDPQIVLGNRNSNTLLTYSSVDWIGQQWPSRDIDSALDRTDTIWWDELVDGLRPSLAKIFPSHSGDGNGIWDNQRHLCGDWES
jgi:hypothetical protein